MRILSNLDLIQSVSFQILYNKEKYYILNFLYWYEKFPSHYFREHGSMMSVVGNVNGGFDPREEYTVLDPAYSVFVFDFVSNSFI